MLKSLTPNMMVEDVNRTIEFYRDVLGFELTANVPESGQFGWASMKLGGVEVMFQARHSLSEEIPHFEALPFGASLTYFIGVSDVKALYEKLKDRVKVVMDFRTTFYGTQEFAFLDNNGFVLMYAEQT